MTSALHHRGPDSSDVWTSIHGRVSLGHARLAIVDLSENGKQPMLSHCGRFVIVFNGEIYNHLDIRARLGNNVRWRGYSDTETLLEAIVQWGVVAALQAAVGMFALALWDLENRTLTLARDRMGEKPLNYGHGSEGLAFASELKSLRKCPGLDLTPNVDALRAYVRVGYIACPNSVYRGVRKLPPGTLVTFNSPNDRGSLMPYWTLPQPGINAQTAEFGTNDQRWVFELEQLLEASVRQQLVADVPLGAFLSGGIDSSLVVAVMQRVSSRRVRTFSMGVPNSADDESEHARMVAKHLGTDHTEMFVTPDDVLATVPQLAGIFDEPFSDSSQVPTVLLSRLTRQHVTVALSGDAGDELFGGYNRYITAAHLAPIVHGVPQPVRRAIAWAMRCVPAEVWDRLSADKRLKRLLKLPLALGEKMSRLSSFLAASNGQQAYLATVSQWFDESSIPLRTAGPTPQFPECASIPLPQQMMWWDMQSYLPDDILVKVDRASMAYGLETRVPFLDHRIVEFALAMPINVKLRNGQSKWLLRELLARHLPRAMFDRPKQGFTLPLDRWLRGPLRIWAEDLLSKRSLDNSELLVTDKVRAIWQQHLSGTHNNQRGLWTILMLQEWMRTQKTATVTLH